MEKLIIKNVGPIKNVELDLKQCMVFIGPQSSGKSIISKLITIFRSTDFILDSGNSFIKLLEGQNISKFVSDNSELIYLCETYKFHFSHNTMKFEKFFDDFIVDEFKNYFSEESLDELSSEVEEYRKLLMALQEKIEEVENMDDGDQKRVLLEEVKVQLNKTREFGNVINPKMKRNNNLASTFNSLSNYSVYIPAERALIPLLSQSSLTLLNNNIELDLIPKYILSFGERFEVASAEISNYSIEFLNISYKNENNQKRVLTNNQNPILLSESSSGIQSILPALLVIENTYDLKNKGRTFIVEEPELNLYPSAQKEFIYHLVNRCTRKNNSHFNELIVTTHSPYVLSAFNNLLLASLSGKIDKGNTAKIIAEENWLSHLNFGAYFIEDGSATSIVSEATNMIDEDELDSASFEIMSEFNQLFEIYKNA